MRSTALVGGRGDLRPMTEKQGLPALRNGSTEWQRDQMETEMDKANAYAIQVRLLGSRPPLLGWSGHAATPPQQQGMFTSLSLS